MLHADRAWTPIVAERETSSSAPASPFPCRGEMNRYTGCIGARRCRGQGILMCILGRWPDERTGGARRERVTVMPEAPPMVAGPTPTPRPVPARAVSSHGSSERALIGIVSRDRQVRQTVCRHVQTAGYRTVALGTLDVACSALRADEPPAAYLIDGSLLAGDPASERLLADASDASVPVLSLPGGLRASAGAEAALRMAGVWLAVTLRPMTTGRQVG